MADQPRSILPDFGLRRFETIVDKAQRIKREKQAAADKMRADIETLKVNVAAELERQKLVELIREAGVAVKYELLMLPRPKKQGGSNPVVPAIAGAASAVVNNIKALEALTSANPGDP